MSEAFRKDFHTKAGEKMTPDSSKSSFQKAKEGITGSADKVARGAQPDHSKSTTQEISDKFGRSKDETVHGGSKEGFMDKAKHAVGMDHTTTNTRRDHV